MEVFIDGSPFSASVDLHPVPADSTTLELPLLLSRLRHLNSTSSSAGQQSLDYIDCVDAFDDQEPKLTGLWPRGCSDSSAAATVTSKPAMLVAELERLALLADRMALEANSTAESSEISDYKPGAEVKNDSSWSNKRPLELDVVRDKPSVLDRRNQRRTSASSRHAWIDHVQYSDVTVVNGSSVTDDNEVTDDRLVGVRPNWTAASQRTVAAGISSVEDSTTRLTSRTAANNSGCSHKTTMTPSNNQTFIKKTTSAKPETRSPLSADLSRKQYRTNRSKVTSESDAAWAASDCKANLQEPRRRTTSYNGIDRCYPSRSNDQLQRKPALTYVEGSEQLQLEPMSKRKLRSNQNSTENSRKLGTIDSLIVSELSALKLGKFRTDSDTGSSGWQIKNCCNNIDDDVFVTTSDSNTKSVSNDPVTIRTSNDVANCCKNHNPPELETDKSDREGVSETKLTATGSWYDLLPWPPSQPATNKQRRKKKILPKNALSPATESTAGKVDELSVTPQLTGLCKGTDSTSLESHPRPTLYSVPALFVVTIPIIGRVRCRPNPHRRTVCQPHLINFNYTPTADETNSMFHFHDQKSPRLPSRFECDQKMNTETGTMATTSPSAAGIVQTKTPATGTNPAGRTPVTDEKKPRCEQLDGPFNYGRSWYDGLSAANSTDNLTTLTGKAPYT